MKLEKPAVSAIMAAYNAAATVEKSVASLLSQDFGGFEVLICDDRSTDATWDILNQLAELDERVRVFQNGDNRGAGATRNFLMEQARGRYLVIQDADDFSEPGRLERQVDFLEHNPDYAFVATWGRTVDDHGRYSDSSRLIQGEVKKEAFLWGQPFIHASTMFRAPALRAVGGYRLTGDTRHRNEDYDLFMRMYANGHKGYVYPESLYLYYVGGEALARRKYRYRLAEARVRFTNFRALGLLPGGLPYVIKPLVVGLIPQRTLLGLRNRMINLKSRL